jgi:hypothetical protein
VQKRVDLVHRLLFDGVRHHFTQQNTRFMPHLDVIDLPSRMLKKTAEISLARRTIARRIVLGCAVATLSNQ